MNIHIYIHILICMYKYIYIHTYMYVHIHTYLYICIYYICIIHICIFTSKYTRMLEYGVYANAYTDTNPP